MWSRRGGKDGKVLAWRVMLIGFQAGAYRGTLLWDWLVIVHILEQKGLRVSEGKSTDLPHYAIDVANKIEPKCTWGVLKSQGKSSMPKIFGNRQHGRYR